MAGRAEVIEIRCGPPIGGPALCIDLAALVVEAVADFVPDGGAHGAVIGFFNESQTESYRALGLHTIAEVCQGWDEEQGLPGLFASFAAQKSAAAQA